MDVVCVILCLFCLYLLIKIHSIDRRMDDAE